MRVLVTGAAGFLGRALCARLQAAGHALTALGRREADVADPAGLDELHARFVAARPDAVVHLAFPVASRGGDDPETALRETVGGTANVLSAANRANATHVVLASSGKVYGLPERLPTPEDAPSAPTTHLGRLKMLQEALVAGAVRCGAPFGATTLRLFNVYGPGLREGFLVPRLVAGLRDGGLLRLGELDHRRDWLHVDDACRAFETVLERPPSVGVTRVLNVGSGSTASVRDLLDHLAHVSARTAKVHSDPARGRPDEPPEERADTTRLRALGWQPQVDLATGVRMLWASAMEGASE